MTFVILPKSVRQRSATNVETQQNYIKWCIFISIILKETVERKYTLIFSLVIPSIFWIKDPSRGMNYPKICTIKEIYGITWNSKWGGKKARKLKVLALTYEFYLGCSNQPKAHVDTENHQLCSAWYQQITWSTFFPSKVFEIKQIPEHRQMNFMIICYYIFSPG